MQVGHYFHSGLYPERKKKCQLVSLSGYSKKTKSTVQHIAMFSVKVKYLFRLWKARLQKWYCQQQQLFSQVFLEEAIKIT